MKKSKAIPITIVLCGFILLCVSIINIVSAVEKHKTGLEQIDQNKVDAYTNLDLMLKVEVDQLFEDLDLVYKEFEQGQYSEEEAMELAKSTIRDSSYGDRGYFWADDYEGTNIVLLGREDIEGKNRIDLQDVQGNYLIKDCIEAARNGKSYVDYYFPKLAEVEPSRKRAYVREYPTYGWVIGTSTYVEIEDDVEGIAHLDSVFTSQMIMSTVGIVAGLFIAIVAGLVLLFTHLNNKKS